MGGGVSLQYAPEERRGAWPRGGLPWETQQPGRPAGPGGQASTGHSGHGPGEHRQVVLSFFGFRIFLQRVSSVFCRCSVTGDGCS